MDKVLEASLPFALIDHIGYSALKPIGKDQNLLKASKLLRKDEELHLVRLHTAGVMVPLRHFLYQRDETDSVTR